MRSIDADKLTGKQTTGVILTAVSDLRDTIDTIERTVAMARDESEHEDDREGAREEAAGAMDELFAEFEAFQRICAERLT